MAEALKSIPISAVTKHIDGDVKSLANKYKKTANPNHENWREVLQGMQISFNKIYSEPPICIEIIQAGVKNTFGTLGNFSVLIGKAKSRKTFLISLFIAASLSLNKLGQSIAVSLPRNKNRILFFDTEQSQYDVSRVVNRILTLSGNNNPLNFEAYSLRALPPKDRLFIIEQKIYDSDEFGILVIDGLRDLISDINSPEEATMITSKLLKWTEEKNIHIITVLHQNKGDNNARGHLGSELVNKAESVASVEKDGELSIVKSEYFRGKDFEDFAFSVNENGLPYILEQWAGKENSKKKKLTACEVPKETHVKCLKEIFSNGVPKKYKDLQEDIKVNFQSFDVHLIHAQLVDFVSYYRMNGWVTDTGGQGRSGNQYSLNKSIS